MKIKFVQVPIIEINNRNFILLDDCIEDLNHDNKEIKIVLDKEILSKFYNCSPDQLQIRLESKTFSKEKKIIQGKIKEQLKEISAKTNMKNVKKWFLEIKDKAIRDQKNGKHIGFQQFILQCLKNDHKRINENLPETNVKKSKSNIKESKSNTKSSNSNVDFKNSLLDFLKEISNSIESNTIPVPNENSHALFSEDFIRILVESFTLFREYKDEDQIFKIFKYIKAYTRYYNTLNSVAITYASLPHAHIAKTVPKKEKSAWKEKENYWDGVPVKLWQAKHIFQYIEFKSRKTYGKDSFEFLSYEGLRKRAAAFGQIKKQLIIPFEKNKFVDKGEIKTYLDWVFDEEAKRAKFKINLNFVLNASVMDNWLQKRKGGQNVSLDDEEIDSDLWK